MNQEYNNNDNNNNYKKHVNAINQTWQSKKNEQIAQYDIIMYIIAQFKVDRPS